MKRLLASILIFLYIPCFAGCGYSHQVNEMAYVVAMGLDACEGGVEVSLQFAKPLAIAGEVKSEETEGEEPVSENEGAALISVGAIDIYTAINIIGNTLSKRINLTHCKLLLFSAELARGGITEYTDILMKDNQFRPNTFAAVSLCKAKEYLKAVKPEMEMNPAKYYTRAFSKTTGSFIPEATLRDLFINIHAEGQEAALPLVGQTAEEGGDGKASSGSFKPGELNKTAENKTEISGMAAFFEGKMIRALPSRQAELYNLLTDKYKESYYSIPSQTEEGRFITAKLYKRKKTKIRTEITDGCPKISVSVRLVAELFEYPGADMQALGETGIERAISENMQRALTEFAEYTAAELKSDISGFGRHAKKSFPILSSGGAMNGRKNSPPRL